MADNLFKNLFELIRAVGIRMLSQGARERACLPISAACLPEVRSRTCATSSLVCATKISFSGSKNSSIPSQKSVNKQAPAPAASNTRVAGENPKRAMLSRLMFKIIRALQLKAL